jgi:ribosomal protein S18 acetylase RimI-like enzyme
MNITFASSEHAEQIAALNAANWVSTYSEDMSASYLQHVAPTERLAIWQERFKNPSENQFVLVALEDGRLFGFSCAFFGEHSDWGSYLDNLHVEQSHQGRGIGRSLLRHTASVCEQKCPGLGMYLFVAQSNMRAQNLYLSLGAQNFPTADWNAPDGSCIPIFRSSWTSAVILAKVTANLTFERDCREATRLSPST